MIKVTVTQEDFADCSGYGSITHCPLAIALKRTLPTCRISVGGNLVSIDRRDHLIMNFEDWRSDRVIDLINRAKRGEKVENVEVILE